MGSYEKGSFKRKSAIDLIKAVLFPVSYRIKALKRGIVYCLHYIISLHDALFVFRGNKVL